jgi:hypothetical protein
VVDAIAAGRSFQEAIPVAMPSPSRGRLAAGLCPPQ